LITPSRSMKMAGPFAVLFSSEKRIRSKTSFGSHAVDRTYSYSPHAESSLKS